MSAPASLGKRASATLFDLGLFYVPFLGAESSWSPQPVKVVFAAATLAVLGAQARLLAAEGATYGKRRWGLRVVSRATGENAGFLVNAVLRAGVCWLPAVAAMAFDAFPLWLLIDVLVLLWRRDRRALHDLVSGTEVVEASRDTI